MAEGGALRELLALFQLSVDADELEKGTKKVEGFIGKLKAVGGVLAEAFAIKFVKDFVSEQIEAAAHLQDLSERLDVSATSLKDFAGIAIGAGFDLDTAAGALSHLNMNLGEARLKGGDAALAFMRLGVHIRDARNHARPLPDVLEDVAEGLSKLPDQQVRAAYAMRLFGREGRNLLPVFAGGREAMREHIKELKELGSELGDKFPEDAKKAREEGEKFNIVVQSIKDRIIAFFLPAIMKTLTFFKKLAIGFLDMIKKTTLLRTATILLAGIFSYKLITSLLSVMRVLGLLGPTLAATIAKLLAFAWPILVIALLYLVFDDLFALMKGGKSVIGDFLDSMLGIGAGAVLGLYLNAVLKDTLRFFGDIAVIIVDSVIVAIQATADAVIALSNVMADLTTGHYDRVGKDFTDGFKDLPALTTNIKKAAADLAGGHTSAIGRVNALGAAGVDPRKALAALNAPGGEDVLGGPIPPGLRPALPGVRQPQTFQRAGGPVVPLATTAVAPRQPISFERTSPPAPNVVHQTNSTNVVVHTSSDKPKAVGEAVGQGVATTQEKANNNAYQQAVRQ